MKVRDTFALGEDVFVGGREQTVGKVIMIEMFGEILSEGCFDLGHQINSKDQR